jgi:transcriptional regulator with PAS, ATPase and Fis domain
MISGSKNISRLPYCSAPSHQVSEKGIELGEGSPTHLRELVDFFELVLNNVYSGIIVCDKDCRIVFMNEVYAKLLDTDRHRAVGRDITEYFPASRLSNVIASGKAELGQKCSLRTDTPLLLVNRIPLKHENETTGVILQTIFRDYQAFTDLAARLNLLEREVKFYKKGLDSVLSARYTFDSIIGRSKSIREAKQLSEKYARTDAPVLILGATGTGKELFAHAVHNASLRCSAPFVCLNCAAIPRELLESELFGYESGAFTGASKKGKPGQIELAHGGTLFLDEIGDLPLSAQAKLLRVLESRTLDRVGGVKSVQVDFRLVAATNRNLRDMIPLNTFREDLFYRLNTMTVWIPPLSKRTEDIPSLVKKILSGLEKPGLRISKRAMSLLENYPWPGNVRELKNVIERAVSLTESDTIDVDQLPEEIHPKEPPKLSGNPNRSLAEEIADFEKQLLIGVLQATQGNMSRSSKRLGISRSTLYEKCHRHGLL